jgi:DNA-binding MltR family transcriptional regulator
MSISSAPKEIKSKIGRIPIEKLSSESKNLFSILSSEPDFSKVLIAASFLDQSLSSMLYRYFLESRVANLLLDSRGALGTFSTRIDLSYVLGLINKPIFQDLSTISEIRNIFAHSHLTVSFKTPIIVEKCSKLKYLDLCFNDDLFGNVHTVSDRFSLTVVMISQVLLVTGLGNKHKEQNKNFLAKSKE